MKEPKTLTLAEAEAALGRLESSRATLVSRQSAIAAKLEAAEQSARERYFEDGRGAVAELSQVKFDADTELGLIASTLQKLDGAEKSAERDVALAKIADLRWRANENRAEIERVNAKVTPLLKKLGDIVGVPLGLEILAASRTAEGNFAAAEMPGLPAPALLNPSEIMLLNADIGAQYARPIQRKLHDEAVRLDGEAYRLEIDLATFDDQPASRAGLDEGLRGDLYGDSIAIQPPPKLVMPGSKDDVFTSRADHIDAALRNR